MFLELSFKKLYPFLSYMPQKGYCKVTNWDKAPSIPSQVSSEGAEDSEPN